ncbi:MAG: hypothetical protein ACI8R9_002420 [Paraglaciecola sp.]
MIFACFCAKIYGEVVAIYLKVITLLTTTGADLWAAGMSGGSIVRFNFAFFKIVLLFVAPVHW